MRGLLAQERAVLESLAMQERTLDQLESDLGLEREGLLNVLSYFILETVIGYKQKIYFIKQEHCRSWLQKRESDPAEFLELIEAGLMAQTHKKQETVGVPQLLFRKVWMDKSEKIAFERMVQNFDIFLKNLHEKGVKKKRKPKSADQQMVFFMHESYGNVLKKITQR